MRKRLSTTLMSLTLAATVPFAGTAVANAAPSYTTSVYAEYYDAEKDPALADRAREMTEALETINSVPDSVLVQGDKATQEWLATHSQMTSTRASVAGCTAAIALFLGTNLVSAAKILKIKKLIAQLGGVREAVQIMWGASFSYEKMKAAGGTIAALAGEFFGVTSIREKCFN